MIESDCPSQEENLYFRVGRLKTLLAVSSLMWRRLPEIAGLVSNQKDATAVRSAMIKLISEVSAIKVFWPGEEKTTTDDKNVV